MTGRDASARILIVEDSLGIAKALNRALSLYRDGVYRVQVCDSGETALEQLHETPFDLLISDLCLPGMDGLELLERTHQFRPDVRSVLITAFGSPEVEERARKLADAYLPKPFRLRDIIRLVERLLSEPTTRVRKDVPTVARPAVPGKKAAGRDAADVTAVADRRKTAHLILLACDLDGTLAEAGNVSPQMAPQMWDALHRAKMGGLILILVTGRTLDSFVAEGPYADLCEAIVAENGAVVYFPRRDTVLLPFGRLNPRVLQRLETLGVPLERGMAIAATWPPHDEAVIKALRESRSGATVEYNLGGVMVLPPGATKGTGLLYALRELGYSPRNVVACGDGENDRSLFEVAELAVAVSNAQPTLKAAADTVLAQPDGEGIQTLIADLLDGRTPARRPRPDRRLLLGHRMSGAPIHLDPFALVENNLGILGASGSGKSWLAGLLAEELLTQGYQVCIIDPEGDYRGLGTSPHTLLLGRPERPLPAVADVINFTEWHDISLVLDFSVHSPSERTAYIEEFLRALRGLRARRGRPHYVLVDEIQNLCPLEGGELTDLFLESMQWGGFCIVSYRPSQIAPALLATLDHWLITRLALPEEIEALRPRLTRYESGAAALDQLPTLSKGLAYLALGATGQWEPTIKDVVKFRVGPRTIPHIRHLHKYLRAPLPTPKRFYFCDGEGHYLGRAAANLWEFREALSEIPTGSLRYHLKRGDFERWLQSILRDDELARRMRKVGSRDLAGEALRQALLEVVIDRYEELANLA